MSLKKEIEAAKKAIFKNKRVKKRIGEKAVEIIRNRTKNRKVLSDGNAKNPQRVSLVRNPDLNPMYVDQRKRLASKKGEFFAPARSNLTLSGQMLKALTYEIQDNFINIFVKDSSRKAVKFSSKPTVNIDSYNYSVGGDKTNAEVAELVSKKRPFLGLAKNEARILEAEFQDIINDVIKKI